MDLSASQAQAVKVTHRELFWMFLKAELAFGGGLGILAVLEEELVRRLHYFATERLKELMPIEQLLYAFAIARVTPGQANVMWLRSGISCSGWQGQFWR